jgi:hypothetical protein
VPDYASGTCRDIRFSQLVLEYGVDVPQFDETVRSRAEAEDLKPKALVAAMKDECPELISARDSAAKRGRNATVRQVPRPGSVPNAESIDDGRLSCDERYANARSPIFTPEEQESLVAAVDVDCQ